MPLQKELESLQAGTNAITAQAAEKERLKMEQNAKLKELLLGHQYGMEESDHKIKSEHAADSDFQQESINRGLKVQDSLDKLKPGIKHNVGVSKEGFTVGESETDPYAKIMGRQQTGDAQARQKAMDFYNHQFPAMQKQAGELMSSYPAVADPKNTMSLGLAKGQALRAMGMNRFNEAESNALIGPSLTAKMARVMNFAGDDNSPLTDAQRKDVLDLMMSGIQELGTKHKQISDQAMGTYRVSPYANETGAQTIMAQLGQNGFGKQVDDFVNKYQAPAQTAGGQPQTIVPQNPGTMDRLKQFFSGLTSGKPSAPAPAQVQQTARYVPPMPNQAPQAPTAPVGSSESAFAQPGTPQVNPQLGMSRQQVQVPVQDPRQRLLELRQKAMANQRPGT